MNVSEWVLNSTSASYLLNDSGLTTLTLRFSSRFTRTTFSRSRAKEMNRNPDTLKEAADRRKQRQKMNKARGSDDPSAAPTDPRSSQEEASSGTTVIWFSTSSRTRTTSRWQRWKRRQVLYGQRVFEGQVQGQVQRQERGEEADYLQIPRTMRVSVFILNLIDWIVIVVIPRPLPYDWEEF